MPLTKLNKPKPNSKLIFRKKHMKKKLEVSGKGKEMILVLNQHGGE